MTRFGGDVKGDFADMNVDGGRAFTNPVARTPLMISPCFYFQVYMVWSPRVLLGPPRFIAKLKPFSVKGWIKR